MTSNDIYVRDHVELQDAVSMEEAAARHKVIEQYLTGNLGYKKSLHLLGCSKSTFYRLIKKFDSSAGPSTLLRDPRGRKNGQKFLAGEVEDVIKEAIKKQYKGRACSYSRVWREVRDECILLGLPVPSLGAVAARIKAMNIKELYRLKHGAQASSEKYGIKRGKLSVNRPLEVTQIDHTLVDIIICDDVAREPLGRPWVTLLIDLYTRVILSYYLSWHAPSRVSVAATLAYAVADKQSYLKRIGCEDARHPFSGKPQAIHADNAREFRSASMVKGCAKNGIALKWRPYGRKHYGGHVERLIGTLMTTEVHFLPGTTYSNTQQRGRYNSEKKSAMTFKEFGQWFARQVAVYHSEKHSGIGAAPGDAWFNYFGENRAKSMSARQVEEFKIDFLPGDNRKVGVKGILLKNNYYYSPELLPHVGETLPVRYDPLSLKKIWIWLNRQYIECPFSDMTKNDFILEDDCLNRKTFGAAGCAAWMGGKERAKLRKEAEIIVRKSKSETRKVRKREAATKEYQEYNKVVSGKEERLSGDKEVAIDYSYKPVPFLSE